MRSFFSYRIRARLSLAAPLLLAGCAAAGRTASPSATAPADLETFLRNYFRTWSEGDLDRYRALFAPEATVYYLRRGRVVWALRRDAFVERQRRVRDAARERPVERMEEHRVWKDGAAATVVARYVLQDGARRVRGTDRFVLARDTAGRWRILSLLFYTDDELRRALPGDAP